MNRTLRLPSYTIPDESTPQRSVWLGVPQKRDQRRVVVFFLVEKGAAVSLSSRGRDQCNRCSLREIHVTRAAKSAQVFTSVSASFPLSLFLPVHDMTELQSSSAAAAVTTPPATQTTPATMAQARAPSNNFASTLEMSAEEKATAPQLEPAFEALLRSGNIHEEVTWACRVQDILDREVFVALHHTVEGSCKQCLQDLASIRQWGSHTTVR